MRQQLLLIIMFFVLTAGGCDSNRNDDKMLSFKDSKTQVETPNIPRNIATIERETQEYRLVKDAAAKEKKADMDLMAAERSGASRTSN